MSKLKSRLRRIHRLYLQPLLPQRSWYTFESLVVARFTSLSGFVVGVVGSLDWSPLLGLTGFDQKQMMFTGGVILLIGLSTEVARRMNGGLSQP